MTNQQSPAARSNRPKNNNVIRRSNYDEFHDDFPTPPWAVRAFFEYVAPELTLNARCMTVLEPACGRGHMVGALKKYGFKVKASDKFNYKKGFCVADYLDDAKFEPYDLMFTNPPYKLANQFVLRGLKEATRGVAVLLRTIWMESVTRHDQIFAPTPPTAVFVFSRRMQAAHGRLVRGGGAMMSHSWFYWDKLHALDGKETRLGWIPPDAQAKLERDEDYK